MRALSEAPIEAPWHCIFLVIVGVGNFVLGPVNRAYFDRVSRFCRKAGDTTTLLGEPINWIIIVTLWDTLKWTRHRDLLKSHWRMLPDTEKRQIEIRMCFFWTVWLQWAVALHSRCFLVLVSNIRSHYWFVFTNSLRYGIAHSSKRSREIPITYFFFRHWDRE